ncbi:MAG TPA: hypothetical protein VKE26_26200 [Xanthobacteraceae bacterium]|nr:hypothetical protein [Xanthobacteraceae bacterium]
MVKVTFDFRTPTWTRYGNTVLVETRDDVTLQHPAIRAVSGPEAVIEITEIRDVTAEEEARDRTYTQRLATYIERAADGRGAGRGWL